VILLAILGSIIKAVQRTKAIFHKIFTLGIDGDLSPKLEHLVK